MQFTIRLPKTAKWAHMFIARLLLLEMCIITSNATRATAVEVCALDKQSVLYSIEILMEKQQQPKYWYMTD